MKTSPLGQFLRSLIWVMSRTTQILLPFSAFSADYRGIVLI